MRSQPAPPASAIVPSAVAVVAIAAVIGAVWGAEAFVAACLVGSILGGLVITNAK